jgi:hypothetical protein
MPRKPVFAMRTQVPVGQSKHEVESLLRKHGGDQIYTGSDHSTGVGFVGFTLQGRMFRVKIRRREGSRVDPEQLEREQWRALVLVVKGQLELIASGDFTAEQVFMSFLVLPNNATAGEALAPVLEEAYRTGAMPNIFEAMSGGPKQLGAG